MCNMCACNAINWCFAFPGQRAQVLIMYGSTGELDTCSSALMHDIDIMHK